MRTGPALTKIIRGGSVLPRKAPMVRACRLIRNIGRYLVAETKTHHPRCQLAPYGPEDGLQRT